MTPAELSGRAEWLEADGLGGFASGTVSGIRTRRYHALLLAATAPPTGRVVLVNGFDAWVDTTAGSFPITSQAYPPGLVAPDGARRIESFEPEPWPRWMFRLEDGTRIEQEIFAVKGAPIVALAWRLMKEPIRRGASAPSGSTSRGVRGARANRAPRAATAAPVHATLWLRPFLSGRDSHALHHENGAFRFDADVSGERVAWRPYASLPRIVALTNGEYAHDPDWYRNFYYETERERGLDCLEDLASPGIFRWDLNRSEAVWILAAEGAGSTAAAARATSASASTPSISTASSTAAKTLARLRASERRRRSAFASSHDRAADAYLVRRGAGATIVAGYPWFADWGRDTFIALRGLCLATGRLDEARAILLEWAGTISEGMLPNRFPDAGGAPEYNSVDASLWFVVAVHELLSAATAAAIPPRARARLVAAVEAILDGYSRGTRHGIGADADGLLAAGAPGVQLTWMDAKVGDWVVTPRIGKPVEVQALWVNALRIGARLLAGTDAGRRARGATAGARARDWLALHDRALASFRDRFWNESRGWLHDVIDVDHVPGRVDSALRPNQIFAVGGLPFALLDGDRARRVVDAIEASLLTPLGLRTLAPGEPGYAPRYEGGPHARDSAYHNGTVWPWLIGPFVEAWVRVRGGSRDAKRKARSRFLEPLLARIGGDAAAAATAGVDRASAATGLGHLPEIADGDPPHAPRGCPFQAWSLGEAIRLDRVVL